MKTTKVILNGKIHWFAFDPQTDDPREGATLTMVAWEDERDGGGRLPPGKYAEKEAWAIANKKLGLPV